jgi:alkylated DNA nucleotide flippase Atl1
MSRLDELWKVVQSIPCGNVASYGAVGRALTNPVSGLLVGRWMATCPQDVPWWRVVGSDGYCPVWKRDVRLFEEQRSRLRAEDVEMVDDRVPPEYFWDPETLA